MVTRSRDATERARALKVIQGVVDRVQENYLLLVPEMLPFLSELLEDPEIPIVAQYAAAAQAPGAALGRGPERNT